MGKVWVHVTGGVAREEAASASSPYVFVLRRD